MVYLFPEEFALKNGTNALSQSFSLTQRNTRLGGATALVLQISSACAHEYNVTFPLGQQILVVAPEQPMPAPVLVSAQISNDGTQLIVTFSADTNQAGFSDRFVCTGAFQFLGAESASCRWTSPMIMVAYLGPSAVLLPGDNVTTPSRTLKTICTTSAKRCLTWPFSPSMTVSVLPAAAPVKPTVVISAPAMIGKCASLTLDLSGSSGTGGRSWSLSRFSVSSVNKNAANITQFLMSSYKFNPPSAIPSTLLTPGSYNITVVLCNYMGKCGQSIFSLTVVGVIIPTAIIAGGDVSTTPMATLQMTADAFLPACNASASTHGLKYKWTLFQGENGRWMNISRSIKSVSVVPSLFKLSPYTLSINYAYKVQLTVFEAFGTPVTSQAMITVVSGQLIAVLSGGSTIGVHVGSVAVIDASKSYDQDISPSSGYWPGIGLMYTWSCVQYLPQISGRCPLGIPVTLNPASPVLKALTNTSRIGDGAVVKMTVTAGVRSAQASVNVIVLVPTAPIVSLNTNAGPVFSPSNVLIINATIAFSTAAVAQWTVSNAAVHLGAIALTPVQAQLVPAASLRYGSIGYVQTVSLVLTPNSLPPLSSLVFLLRCTDASGTSSIGTIPVYVNGPPQPGNKELLLGLLIQIIYIVYLSVLLLLFSPLFLTSSIRLSS